MELPSSMTWQGVTSALATFGGPVSSPKIKGLVDIKDTEFTIVDWVRKPAGTSAAVEFEGVMGQDSMLSIERLELVLPPFRFATKGKVRLTGVFALDASFVSGPVSVAGLPQGMTVGPMKDGIVEVSLDVKGKGNDWHAWQINGWVALTGGLVTPPAWNIPSATCTYGQRSFGPAPKSNAWPSRSKTATSAFPVR